MFNVKQKNTLIMKYLALLCLCFLLLYIYHINPFLTNISILYPLKSPEKLWFSGVFRVYKMGALARALAKNCN